MFKVLILAPDTPAHSIATLVFNLRQFGYEVARLPLDGGGDAVQAVYGLFGGLPPDLLLADLSTVTDCLPLRHASQLLQEAWGGDAPPPARLALFTPSHLAQPEWPAYADDFLLPPYDIREVRARISLYAYRKRHIQTDDTLSLADLVLDLAGGKARDLSGRVLPLTPREHQLLRFLCQHQGKFFLRERLLDLVWGVDYQGGERTVDIHIRRLRAKLPPGAAGLLETQRGGGYGLRSSE